MRSLVTHIITKRDHISVEVLDTEDEGEGQDLSVSLGDDVTLIGSRDAVLQWAEELSFKVRMVER